MIQNIIIQKIKHHLIRNKKNYTRLGGKSS